MFWYNIYTASTLALKSNKIRTGLTVAIIAVGISALVSILTVIEIMKWNIYNNFAGMGANTFTIMADRKAVARNNNVPVLSLQQAIHFDEAFPYTYLNTVTFFASQAEKISYENKETAPNITLLAADEKYLKVSSTNLLHGRNFNKKEINDHQRICILGYGIAKKLFKFPEVAIGKKVKSNDGNAYTVIGVMESKGSSLINRIDQMMILPLGTATVYYGNTKNCVITVSVSDIKSLDFVMSEATGFINKIAKQKLNEPKQFKISKNDELANMFLNNISFISIAATLIGFITLLGAAIALMNILLVSVGERTQETGLLKSMGVKNKVIKYQYLTESVLISMRGGTIGIVAGILLGNFLSLLFESPFVIPWLWIFFGIMICVVVGILSGIYPANKASRMNPIESLRYE